jgi:hypothetical protein
MKFPSFQLPKLTWRAALGMVILAILIGGMIGIGAKIFSRSGSTDSTETAAVQPSDKDQNSEASKGSDTETKKGSETDTKKGSETDTKKGSETDTKKGPETDTKKGPETDTKKGPDADKKKGPDADTKKGPDADTKKGPDADTKKGPDADTKKGPDADKKGKEKEKEKTPLEQLKAEVDRVIANKKAGNFNIEVPAGVTDREFDALVTETHKKLNPGGGRSLGTARKMLGSTPGERYVNLILR